MNETNETDVTDGTTGQRESPPQRPDREAFLRRLEKSSASDQQMDSSCDLAGVKESHQQSETIESIAVDEELNSFLREHNLAPDRLDPASLSYLMSERTVGDSKVVDSVREVRDGTLGDEEDEEEEGDMENMIHLKIIKLLETQLVAMSEMREEINGLRRRMDEGVAVPTRAYDLQRNEGNGGTPRQQQQENGREMAGNRVDEGQVEFRMGFTMLGHFGEWFSQTLLYRIVRNAYEDALANNVRVNFDLNLLAKLAFAIMLFGRALSRGIARGDKALQAEAYQKILILSCVAVLTFMVQTGIMSFLLRLFKDLPRYIEEAMPVNIVGEDGRPNVRRDQRDQRRVNDADDHNQQQQAPQHNRNDEDEMAQVRRRLTDGGIDREGGVPVDIWYIVAGYVLSLLPTWRPQPLVNQEREEGQRNENPVNDAADEGENFPAE
eukprot:CAMPEP_0116076890 /NCGR_PEP_ID=MMETSP0322-20121206/17539_1 /TAXON_ID=163516 /ORGANISM="Leptocylindrus danicus var. apora, Strain B651" /LENGTH=436 /DNA_ID=CAMNT_0003567305 /DNA_START=18 /DNA_END=1328 /DNA_ORIENTATION=+